MKPRYTCPICKGANVQLSFPVWIPANAMDEVKGWEPDWEASPEKDGDKGWCVDCALHILVDDNGEEDEEE